MPRRPYGEKPRDYWSYDPHREAALDAEVSDVEPVPAPEYFDNEGSLMQPNEIDALHWEPEAERTTIGYVP